MARSSVITLVLLTALGCTPRVPPPASHEAPPPSEPTPAPAMTISSVTAPGDAALQLRPTAIDCSWGSVGVVSADAPIPYWVMGVVELSPDRAVEGLTIRSVELWTEDGVSMGTGERERSLHRVGPEATVFSGEPDPFTGRLDADQTVRLRFRARMPDAFAERLSAGAPHHYRLTLDTAEGAIIRLSGAVGAPWPTA